MFEDATTLQVSGDHPLAAHLTHHDIAASTLETWYERGIQMLDGGHVSLIDSDDGAVVSLIDSASSDDGYLVSILAGPDGVVATCDCPVRERHRLLWCKHRVAVATCALEAAGEPRPDPGRVIHMVDVPLEDRPLAWTATVGYGTVRHFPRGRMANGVTRCSITAELARATKDLPICKRCKATFASETA